MKTVTMSALVLLMLSAAPRAQQAVASTASAAKAAEPSYKTHKLTRAEFDTLVAEPGRILLIDVRRPDEVASVGGFPVYLSIPAADIEKHLAWIPKDRAIITVSNHANRSGRVGDVLSARGFTVAGTIGTQDYEAAGGTVIKSAPPTANSASK